MSESVAHERVVAMVAVSFWSRVPGTDGQVHYLMQDASFGETIVLNDIQEEARLDALGALAAPGATREDVEREREAKISAYTQARRQVSAAVAG